MRALLCLLLCPILAAPASAQIQPQPGDRTVARAADTTGAAPSRAELARRIDLLAQELDDLKLGPVSGPPESRFGLGPAASKVYAAGRGVSIGGYGEMLYERFGRRQQNGVRAELLDRLDFVRQIVYVGYKFDTRILLNSEIEFEHATTEKHGSVSVEFAYVDFLLGPSVNLRAGMVLVPMGFVNELHEPPTFLGAHRPLVEQRIIPSTWGANGIGLFGQLARGLAYRAFLIESLRAVRGVDDAHEGFGAEGLREGRQGGSESRLHDVAGVARLEYADHGALVGAALFRGATAQGDTTPDGKHFDATSTIYAAHAQLRSHGVRLRGLVAGARVKDAAEIDRASALTPQQSVGSELLGWYVEGGYELLQRLAPGSRFELVPYVRYESLDTQRAVPAGFNADPANDLQVLTTGLAFYPHPQVVFKGDFERRHNGAHTGTNQWNLSLGYLF